MKKELEIIEDLKVSAKKLIPIKGLEIRFKIGMPINKGLIPDLIMHVSYKNIQFDMAGEVISQHSTSTLKAKISALKSYVVHGRNLVPIIIAEYLSPERREHCMNEGLCYLDLSGNVLIKYESLYIERIGFPNRRPEKRKGRGVFSDKASLILREAFKDIKRPWGVRELAGSVGINPGFISRLSEELEKRNYISRKNSRLIFKDPESILEDWVREYDYRKNKEVRFFCLGKGPDEIIDKIKRLKIPEKLIYAFGFHSGANLISPYSVYNEVHIYIKDENEIRWFADNLKLKQVDSGANLIFLLPHYKHSVFYDIQQVDSLKVVSDIQLYLDLYKYPIRGVEQAEYIFEKRLKKYFKG
jgi:hypothetical protein